MAGFIFQELDPAAFDGFGHDRLGRAFGLFGPGKSSLDLRQVVPVDYHHLPAKSLQTFGVSRGIVAVHGLVCLAPAVDVDNRHQVVGLIMGG